MEATEPMTTEDLAKSLILSEDQSNDEDGTAPDEPTVAEEITDEPVVQEEPDDDEVEASQDDEDDDNADDEPEPEDEVEPAQLHTVKVDGAETQVTYDDLVKGYSGQAYVQKGMSENAAKSKDLDAQAQTLQSERQAVLQAFQALQSGNLTPAPQLPTADADADPIGWMQQQAQYQRQMEQYQQEQTAFQQIQAQEQAQSEAARQRMMAEQRQKAIELVPDLGDAEKAPKIMQQMKKAASEYGLGDADLAGVTDARALAILYDAAQFRALKSSKPEVQKKVEGARPVLKPGAKKAADPKAAQKTRRNRAMQTQRPEDWAKSLLT